MRRYIALMVACGLVASVGCRHIGGKNDCGYNPKDYPIQGPTAPYPTAPVIKPAPPAPPPKGGGNEE